MARVRRRSEVAGWCDEALLTKWEHCRAMRLCMDQQVTTSVLNRDYKVGWDKERYSKAIKDDPGILNLEYPPSDYSMFLPHNFYFCDPPCNNLALPYLISPTLRTESFTLIIKSRGRSLQLQANKRDKHIWLQQLEGCPRNDSLTLGRASGGFPFPTHPVLQYQRN